MAGVSTADLLGGILQQAVLINDQLSKQSKKSASAAATAKSGMSGKISTATDSVQSAVTAIKAMRDVSPADVMKLSVVPLNKVAWKLRGFISILGSTPKGVAKNAMESSQSVVSILNYLQKANVLKLAINLDLFPMESLKKFIEEYSGVVELLAKNKPAHSKQQKKTRKTCQLSRKR